MFLRQLYLAEAQNFQQPTLMSLFQTMSWMLDSLMTKEQEQRSDQANQQAENLPPQFSYNSKRATKAKGSRGLLALNRNVSNAEPSVLRKKQLANQWQLKFLILNLGIRKLLTFQALESDINHKPNKVN